MFVIVIWLAVIVIWCIIATKEGGIYSSVDVRACVCVGSLHDY